jgi:hypothetical protein
MASADRELKLAGYEVFRFGATEFANAAVGRGVAADFFTSLFDRFKVPYFGSAVAHFVKGENPAVPCNET